MSSFRVSFQRHLIWFLLLLVGLFLSITMRAPPSFTLLAPSPPIACCTLPAMASMTLLPSSAPSAHSATLYGWPNGERLVVYFSGTYEGAGDVQLVANRLLPGQTRWSTATPLIDRTRISIDTLRYIRKIGNPLLFRDFSDPKRIHLVFSAVSFGGWAASRLYHTTSEDKGYHWSTIRPLIASPLWNLSTNVRMPPLPSTTGFLLPVYHELLHKRPELWWFDGEHLVRQMSSSFSDINGLLQPAVTFTAPQRLNLFLRAGGDYPHAVHLIRSNDGGKSFSAPIALSFANPNSSIAAARLADGRLLLVGNFTTQNRQSLSATIIDEVHHTNTPPQLIFGGTGEYSYPSLWVDGEAISLAFTWERKHIAVVQFTVAALTQPHPPAPLIPLSFSTSH